MDEIRLNKYDIILMEESKPETQLDSMTETELKPLKEGSFFVSKPD